MKTIYCGLALALVLSGCGPIQRAQIQQQRAAIDAEAAACAQKLKSREFKNHVEEATCANDAYARGARAGIYPFPDIRQVWMAAHLRVAEQLDRGEITETEAKARLLEIGATATAEARRRSVENAQANAATRADDAAATAAYANMIAIGVGMMTGGR
jgi:hypothetical protein